MSTTTGKRRRTYLQNDVFGQAYERIREQYAAGHRLVVCVSGGKDSVVITELAVMAAQETGRLPVEVATRDEEIMLPGTFELLERVAERPEIDFHHILQMMPVLNMFNREMPYFWTFDEDLSPDEWVRQPPPYAYKVKERLMKALVTAERFPPDEGKDVFNVIGIRAAESPARVMAIASSGKAQGDMSRAHLTQKNKWGVRGLRPIYDWEDGDVWKFIADNGLDYNRAYDTLYRLGVPRHHLRIGPPTQRVSAVKTLRLAAKAWPRWFDRVCRRCPGIRAVVHYGTRVLEPERQIGETWQDVFKRVVLGPGNPEWIQERGTRVMDACLARHRGHSTAPFPDVYDCPMCIERLQCWKALAKAMYFGDPVCNVQKIVPYVEPEFFKPGSGKWDPA